LHAGEDIFSHKHVEENGDVVEMRIRTVQKTSMNPEGIAYSLVYVRKGKRLIGYDNFEGHFKEGSSHHKHIGERIVKYMFVDEWKLIEDFTEDIDKIKRGVIK